MAAAAVISACGEGVKLPDTYDERISRVSFVQIGGLKCGKCVNFGVNNEITKFWGVKNKSDFVLVYPWAGTGEKLSSTNGGIPVGHVSF